MLDATVDYIESQFKDSPGTIKHLKRTLHWLLVLRPNASEALKVAALSHDIERSEPDDAGRRQVDDFTDKKFLSWHQDRGASIMSTFLQNNGATPDLVADTAHLIAHHEIGGDKDADLLKDADSISYFENNVGSFLKRVDTKGFDNVKTKFDWMYNRISSEKAREIAQPMYENAISELKKVAQS